MEWGLNLATMLGWLLSSIFVLSLARLARSFWQPRALSELAWSLHRASPSFRTRSRAPGGCSRTL